MTTITISRATVEQALEALEDWDSPMALPAVVALRAALAQQAYTDDLNQRIKLYVGSRCAPPQQPGQQPRSAAPLLTPRELELLHGLIERELWHAITCDAILARPDGNHRMASAQKGWDMERVALLRKLGGIGA